MTCTSRSIWLLGLAFALASAGCGNDVHEHDSLAGTWDIVATHGSSTTHGTLIWDAGAATLTYGDTTITVLMGGQDGTGTSQEPGSSGGVSIHHAGDSIDTGLIPFNIGGTWTLTNSRNPNDGCVAKMAAGAFSNVCTNSGGDYYEMSAVRTGTADSSFGDLGGKWMLQDGGTECQATLAGNSINAICTSASHTEGTLSFTVSGDLASGTSSDGFEFSAHRRL